MNGHRYSRIVVLLVFVNALFVSGTAFSRERAAQNPLATLNAKEVQLRMPGRRAMTLTVQQSEQHANGDRSVHAISSDGNWQLQATLGSAGSFGMLHGKGSDWLLGTDRDGFWVQSIPSSGVSINSCGMSGTHKHTIATGSPQKDATASAAMRTVIDVMLVYNQAMRERYPGQLLDTRFNHLIAIGNQTFANSGLDLAMRLVGTDFYDYPNNNSNFDFRNDLSQALAGNSVPSLQGLAFRRDQLRLCPQPRHHSVWDRA